MIKVFEQNLIALAKRLNAPLYSVGGVVRNYLIDGSVAEDIDLASPVGVEQLAPLLNEFGFTIVAEYKRTGTVVFKSQTQKYEFTSFRKEKYQKGGGHTPISTERTTDIVQDALRRDFKCNAVYYDITNAKFVDPLGGITDIKNKVLDTVKQAEQVFESDGLRLMRLARFSGELNFKPTNQVLASMQKYADNILDISPERIYAELKRILNSDTKYPFSDKAGHYTGLKILSDTRVLDRIIPELTLGRGMVQRADYHNYDVLEHSLRSVLYAPKGIRLIALLHDIGKPLCFKRDGNFYAHAEEGSKLAKEVLRSLKADNRTVDRACTVIKEHMLDLDLKMREQKVRLNIVKNFSIIDDVFALKQADFSACKDDLSIAPTVAKWKGVIEKMRNEDVPFTIKELKISAKDLMDMGLKGSQIGKTLEKVFFSAVTGQVKNDRQNLLKMVETGN